MYGQEVDRYLANPTSEGREELSERYSEAQDILKIYYAAGVLQNEQVLSIDIPSLPDGKIIGTHLATINRHRVRTQSPRSDYPTVILDNNITTQMTSRRRMDAKSMSRLPAPLPRDK